MEGMHLAVDTRQAEGKGAARRLRRQGKIPAILYGDGEPQTLAVDESEWMSKFRLATSNTIINLKNADREHSVLVKDMQDDILSGRVYHIDFYAIKAGKKLHTQVPIHLEGTPCGVREGGILEHKLEALEVICLPKDIPSSFSVDITHLEIGESLHVGEISIPEGVEIRTEENLTVVVISRAKAESEITPESGLDEDLEGAVATDAEEAGEES